MELLVVSVVVGFHHRVTLGSCQSLEVSELDARPCRLIRCQTNRSGSRTWCLLLPPFFAMSETRDCRPRAQAS